MVSLDQICKHKNKSRWARLGASASRTSREEACWVCELEDGRLQEISRTQDTSLTLPLSVVKQIILPPDLSPFYFPGSMLSLKWCWYCISEDNGVQMALCAARAWLSLCFLHSSQSFRYGERFISPFIIVLWKEKGGKKPLNRHNFLTYLYMPILSRDVLCNYCELLKM